MRRVFAQKLNKSQTDKDITKKLEKDYKGDKSWSLIQQVLKEQNKLSDLHDFVKSKNSNAHQQRIRHMKRQSVDLSN